MWVRTLQIGFLHLPPLHSDDLKAGDRYTDRVLTAPARGRARANPQLVGLLPGHAIVFLLRLCLAPGPVPVERSVITHYIQTGIEVLEDCDFTMTGQTTSTARICRGLCRASGVDIPPRDGQQDVSLT